MMNVYDKMINDRLLMEKGRLIQNWGRKGNKIGF